MAQKLALRPAYVAHSVDNIPNSSSHEHVDYQGPTHGELRTVNMQHFGQLGTWSDETFHTKHDDSYQNELLLDRGIERPIPAYLLQCLSNMYDPMSVVERAYVETVLSAMLGDRRRNGWRRAFRYIQAILFLRLKEYIFSVLGRIIDYVAGVPSGMTKGPNGEYMALNWTPFSMTLGAMPGPLWERSRISADITPSSPDTKDAPRDEQF